MQSFDDSRIPSWKETLRLIRPLGGTPRTASGPRASDGITSARVLFMTFPFALILIAVVLLVLDPDFGFPLLPAAIVTAAASGGLVAINIINTRPLSCDDPALSYRTSMFLEIALAEAPVLIAFVLALLDGTFTTYMYALVISVPSFWLAAPTAADIARRQEQLALAGCAVDLVAALLAPPSPRAR